MLVDEYQYRKNKSPVENSDNRYDSIGSWIRSIHDPLSVIEKVILPVVSRETMSVISIQSLLEDIAQILNSVR